MTVQKLHRWSLLGFVALGPLGLISGSPILLVSGLVTVLLIVRGLDNFGEVPVRLARSVIVHGLTVLGLLGALVLFRTDRVDAVLLILLLGLMNRLLLRAGHRDDFLLVALTSTMIAAATTVTPGIEFLLIVLAAVPALVLALWSSQLLGSVEHDPAELNRTRNRSLPPGMGRWVAIAMVMTVMGTAFCTLFPRYKFSRVLGAGAFVRLPGASDSMRLDADGTSDEDDETVVMRVRPDGNLGVSELTGLYARLHTLEDFDGRTWTARDYGDRFTTYRPPASGKQRVQVQLARQSHGYDHPVAVLGRIAPAGVFSPHLKRDAGGRILAGVGRDRQLEYQALLDVPLRDPPPDAEESSLLDVPAELDPRFSALALRLASGADTDEEKVERILRHFQDGFSYSTEPLVGEASHPLVRFLFESKSGHCEMYAAAVATLLRLSGVRSRVATGYYGGRWNRMGGYLAFVQGDAHAWVEFWSEAHRGWRWIDATPEDLRGRRASLALWALARDWYDTVSAIWYERVVDFDGRRQKELYHRALDRFSGFAELLRGQSADSKPKQSSTSAMGTVVMGVGAAILLLVLPGWLVVRRRRSSRALGLRLRKALGARRDIDRSATLGQLLERQPEDLVPEGRRAVEFYERHRFGGAEPEQIAPLIEAIEALERGRRQLTQARD